MRKVTSRVLVLGLLGLFVFVQAMAASPLPSLAGASLPVYSPEIIGDRFRTGTVDKNELVLPEEGLAANALEVAAPAVGQQKYFLILDDYYNTQRVAAFTCRGIGTHGEVWVQNNLSFPNTPTPDPRNPVIVTDEQVNYLVQQFDNVIYPKESEFFATPDSHTGANAVLPGMLGLPSNYYVSSDGIERTIILVSNIRDTSYYNRNYPLYITGFFSTAYETYFDRNVISIDALDWANRVGPNDSPWRPDDGTANDRPYMYEGTFAHEYQHLLHRDMDPDEENWINEGMSDFAAYITGYSDPNTDSHSRSYVRHPYNSLVVWGDRGDLEILSDYGSAYLMQLYLAENYGSAFTQALAHSSLNGIASVDDTLARAGIPGTFQDIYRDWVVANLINDAKKAGGEYAYDGMNLSVVLDGEGDSGAEALPWGPAYYQIPAKPKIESLIIDGVSFLPSPWTVVDDPFEAGDRVLYSGTGDLLNNMVALPVDLTSTTGASLQFKTLYDVEEAWDFAFVQVSADGGATWQSLANEHTTSDCVPDAHPDVIANLPGLTGYSGGWVEQSFDLSAYDGKNIVVAFRYVTDWGSAGNGNLDQPGWYIDDLSVAGFTSDGSSLEPFCGIDEVQGRFAEYMISFAGRKAEGNAEWKVLHLNTQTFDEAQQAELRKFLRDSSLDEIIMVVSRIAPQGSATPAAFDYSVVRRADVPGPKK